jgi:LPXTG-motif cell wall-anchored protein
MMPRCRIAGLALVLALWLALPAVALAQGAGDTQYQDPLAGGNQGSQGGGSAGGAEGSKNPKLSTGPPNMPTPAAVKSKLPRTGAEPGLVALLGTGLLLTGAGLRVRVRRPLA